MAGVRFEEELYTLGVAGCGEGEPTGPAGGDIVFEFEAEHVSVELEGLVLVVHQDTGDSDSDAHGELLVRGGMRRRNVPASTPG